MFIHTDGLGSPVARTNDKGQLISRTRYEPYGATAAGATPTIGFTGHVNDADTGLVYMQQRYYDPYAGRFLSTDPVLTDGNTGRSFNRYVYANNNPYKYIDPDGREIKFAASATDAYKATVVGQINSIRETFTGDTMIRQLEASTNVFEITPSTGESFITPTNPVNSTNGVGSGATVNHDPTWRPIANTTAGPQARPSEIVLAHEFKHAAEADKGKLDNSYYRGCSGRNGVRRVKKGSGGEPVSSLLRQNHRQTLEIPGILDGKAGIGRTHLAQDSSIRGIVHGIYRRSICHNFEQKIREERMKFSKVIGMMILLLVANQAAAQNWRTCANEDQYCRFSGEKRVAYGAGNQWAYQTARNGIACNNRTFGDPVPGVRKSCRYLETVASVVRCAREGDYCSFRGTREVRYGADRRWVSGVFSHGVECSNQVFGDPAPNVVKSCVYDKVAETRHRDHERDRDERWRDREERPRDAGGGASGR